jgi:uncharacterized RDD family membrane protein YckC
VSSILSPGTTFIEVFKMHKVKAPSLLRKLGSMFYDSILVTAIIIIGTVFTLFFTKGESIAVGNLGYQLYLLFLSCAFFVWFWARGGQTAGMAAWKLRLVTLQGQPVSLSRACIRCIAAIPCLLCFGVGLLWSLRDKDRLTLYDRISKTKIISV